MRNLVVVRAGEDSRHASYAHGRQGFDVLVEYFGSVEGRHREHSDLYRHDRTGDLRGMQAVHRLLLDMPHLLEEYDQFWFPDDDIEATPEDVARLFAVQGELGVDLAQPSLTHDSYFVFHALLHHPGFAARYTTFVEVMVPSFSRRALAACLPTFQESTTGCGLEWAWQSVLSRAGMSSAVLDCVQVRHTRPFRSGSLYADLGEHPLRDGRRVAERYGLSLDHPVLVERALDERFEEVPARQLQSLVLLAAPEPTVQDPWWWDQHLDCTRRRRDATQERLARTSMAPGGEQAAGPLSEARARAFRDGVRQGPHGDPAAQDAIAVVRASWRSQRLSDRLAPLPGDAVELVVARAEAPGPVTSSDWELVEDVAEDLAAQRSRGRELVRRLRGSRAPGNPASIAVPHVHPQLVEVVRALSGLPGLRLVITVPLHHDTAEYVADLVEACSTRGVSFDHLDVEVRPTDEDPCTDPSVDVALDRCGETWRPTQPLWTSLEELVLVLEPAPVAS